MRLSRRPADSAAPASHESEADESGDHAIRCAARSNAVDGELILVVEDNEKSRKLVRDVLRFHGFATIDAATAAEGLALARERYPRLILLDIQLPDLDGTAVLTRLRAEPATA